VGADELRNEDDEKDKADSIYQQLVTMATCSETRRPLLTEAPSNEYSTHTDGALCLISSRYQTSAFGLNSHVRLMHFSVNHTIIRPNRYTVW
jgi:hypothetical protein